MVVTRESIERDIREIKDQIEYYENCIKKMNKKMAEKKELLSVLKQYEKRSMDEKTLSKYIFDTTRSVELMDEFESLTEEGFRKYERIFIQNTIWGDAGRYHLIITRLNSSEFVGDITMTDFKNRRGNYSALIKHIEFEVQNVLQSTEKMASMEVIFKMPFLLRAQNSSNRTGYGNEYNGYDLVYEGTLYGETTNYAFIGVVIE